MRPKTTGRDLPPRLIRRTRTSQRGKVWTYYYYTGGGKERPLGTDLIEAKRKWAELEAVDAPKESHRLTDIFDRYIREVLPGKAPRTQRDNIVEFGFLRPVFGAMQVDDLAPHHIAKYRDMRTAKTRGNREIALLSHVFNRAREWGLTRNENPCTGVRKNPESPSDYYCSAAVWDVVYAHGDQALRDAMDLSYLTGQRPPDVRRMLRTDIEGGHLHVGQGKTSMRLRIRTVGQLAELLDRLLATSSSCGTLLAQDNGQPHTYNTLRRRFDQARAAAATASPELADKIKAFKFKDIRARSASDIEDLEAASALLGHTKQDITRRVYRRRGRIASPVK